MMRFLGAQEWARDGVCTNVSVQVSWRDRLRMLVHGRLEVTVFVATEHEVGRTASESRVYVPSIFPHDPGEVEAPLPEGSRT